ncbi:DUF2252 family protein [uncultured Microbacterium sp.]|uniref:DUF2252 family protein n=1 Tax=uncultured Microbacterium sp. TaxID=191216 RepID=UPI0026392744|nr:DUF2252 family protein [uncultured Microbacterium sp.]
MTSIVIAGQASARDERVTDAAARGAVSTYARAMATAVARSPLERYFQHYEVTGRTKALDKRSRDVVKAALRDAQKRTGERAVRRLTERGDDGLLRFIETPPTMTHLEPDLAARVQAAIDAYRLTTNADIRLLLQQFTPSDTVRRVVGVGSVGTRCYITVLQDAGGHPLLLQVKQAGPSVLVEHGRQDVPPGVASLISRSGAPADQSRWRILPAGGGGCRRSRHLFPGGRRGRSRESVLLRAPEHDLGRPAHARAVADRDHRAAGPGREHP